MREEFQMAKVICIIPARNEASRVGRVVETVLGSPLVVARDVWVVDNCSDDGTAEAAEKAGANVLFCETPGKGNAVAYAVRKLAGDDDVILMLDADLVGLRLDHVEKLLRPLISGSNVQSGGVRDGWWFRRLYWRFHIGLSGERAFVAGLLWEIYELDYQGWALEVALNSICRWSPKRQKRHIAKVFLDGVSDTPKIDKYPSAEHAKAARQALFFQWAKGLVRFNLAVPIKHWLQ
jgi:glycosyltransferase involved in cell wall biosynthesis